MNVQSLMTRSPSACRITESANEAARIMWERDCGAVPIVDSEDRVVGIVTDRDICMAAYFQGTPLSHIPVIDIMSAEPCTCEADDDVAAAERMMRQRQIRRLPVIDPDGRLVGMLSLGDVAQKVSHAPDGKQSSTDDRELLATVAAVSTPRSGGTSASGAMAH